MMQQCSIHAIKSLYTLYTQLKQLLPPLFSQGSPYNFPEFVLSVKEELDILLETPPPSFHPSFPKYVLERIRLVAAAI